MSTLEQGDKPLQEDGKRKLNDITKEDECTKKLKLDEDVTSKHPEWNSLESFKFVKFLRSDAQSKSVCIHATARVKESEEQKLVANANSLPDEADAIVILEKKAFDTSDASLDALLSPQTSLKQLFNNDIYGTYESFPPEELSGVKTIIIFPATAKHMEKYQAHEADVIYETPDDYKDITLPYLNDSKFDNQWIYNILEKKKESEFIVYEDPDPEQGYILLPDLKWDRTSMDTMYLSAIVHKHGIKSLRDLGTEHLPLLKNIQDTASKAIEQKYGVEKSKIRAYFHYQPSYYHLHVHFNQVKHTAPGSNVIGAHLLADVINNIEMYPDYYKRKTLAFPCKDNALLHQRFKSKGRI